MSLETRFTVNKVTVQNANMRGLRGILGNEAGVKLRGKVNNGIIYQLTNRSGEQFTFRGRLSDFEPEKLQRVLIPGAVEFSFVARPVLEEAEKIVNGIFERNPELINPNHPSYRLAPYESPLVNFEGLKFAPNVTDIMLYVVLEPGKELPNVQDIDSALYPYGEFIISPNAQVLHYCGTEFDGGKGIMGVDGKFALFRPDFGARREIITAKRMCLPIPSLDYLIQARIKVALANKRVWPRTFEEGALYLRPLLFDHGKILGVDVTGNATYIILAHPVGPYYRSGRLDPISLWASTEYHRSAPGITGYVKAGPNYGPTVFPKHEAKKRGHDEVLYLDPTNSIIDEVGSSNFFGVQKLENGKFRLLTPMYSDDPTKGTILGGGTRDSIITLCREILKWPVYEGDIPIEETLKSCSEAFCTGTAAVISPIGRIEYRGKTYTFNDNKPGEATLKLYDLLTGIQTGKYEDPFGWRWII